MKASCALLLCLIVQEVVSQTDSDDPDDTEYEDEYSEPGATTENCLCVPFTQCEDGRVVSDGSFLLDPRKKVEEVPLEEKYIPPACGPYHVCCTDPEASTIKPYEHHCGGRNPGGINPRIASTQGLGEAEFGEWPWQAAILRRENGQYVFRCGGTLIDESYVLTVAHCAEDFLSNISNTVVRLGEWDTQVTTEFMPHEDHNVSEIIIHPEYTRKNLFNDIALLKLSTPVSFKPHIDSVCLPRRDDDFTGQDCIVTGWGAETYEDGAYSRIMKEVAVPVISKAECQKRYRGTRLGGYFKLYKGFLCAGGEKDNDSCTGDGGGPLVCFRNDNTYTLAGLVSWGIECGREGIPGVYVDVREYVDWITSVTGKPLNEYWSSQ